jgi:peptidoglycan/LPS O-acetylase OafA/YrhL
VGEPPLPGRPTSSRVAPGSRDQTKAIPSFTGRKTSPRGRDAASRAGGAVPNRLDSLTGLRFLAVLYVFAYHVSIYSRVPGWATFLAAPGAAGVSFFFILSGFVLTWSHPAQDRTGRFYRRRFARIVPNHVATWMLALGVLALEGVTVPSLNTLPSLALVQAWVPSPRIYFAANSVSWSLACEVFFYALLPFMLPLLTRLGPRARFQVMALAVLCTVSFQLVSVAFFTGPMQQWLAYIVPVARLPEFVLGILLALQIRDGHWWPVPLLPAMALAGVACIAAGWAPAPFQWVSVTLIPFVLLIGSAAQADIDERPSMFRTRHLITLGLWSYAFFLLHELVLRVGSAMHLGGGPGHSLLWASVLLVVTVVLSGALFTVVERPLERRLRGQPRRQALVHE